MPDQGMDAWKLRAQNVHYSSPFSSQQGNKECLENLLRNEAILTLYSSSILHRRWRSLQLSQWLLSPEQEESRNLEWKKELNRLILLLLVVLLKKSWIRKGIEQTYVIIISSTIEEIWNEKSNWADLNYYY